MPTLPPAVADEAVSLLVDLVRLDTSGGREGPAAQLLAERLRADGYEPALLEKEPGRTNLVVRRKGDGTGGGPLLLTGHLDVVPADPAGWTHPPFGGEIHDGWLWGRGTLDMKGHLAACATVMRHLAREQTRLKRDVIFAAVADEETGFERGSRFLVEQHAELVRAEFALGEAGGVTVHLDGRRLYPIQTSHKGVAWLTLRAKGPTGHGSVPRPDSAPMRLARAVMRLGNVPLPVHVTGAARAMLEGLAAAMGGAARLTLPLLGREALADFVLQSFVGDEKARAVLGATLRNTAAVTGLRAGQVPNVFPATAEATIDARLLPGQTTKDLLRELAEVVDDEAVSFEIQRELPSAETSADTPLYRLLVEAIRRMDPDGRPHPMLAPGACDAGPFAALGIRFYGFSPCVFPEQGPAAPELTHAIDERIPIDGYEKGVQALWDVVAGFCG